MIKFIFACILFNVVNGHHENVQIPVNNCYWQGARWGEFKACGHNEVAVGSCGSGRNADCENHYWDQLKCCRLHPQDSFYHNSCTKYYSRYPGQELSCMDKNKILKGQCGSGKYADCDRAHNIIECCVGGLESSGQVIDADRKSCHWQFAGYGRKLECGRDEAIFGRCGSGQHADCQAKKAFHGIQCCRVIRY